MNKRFLISSTALIAAFAATAPTAPAAGAGAAKAPRVSPDITAKFALTNIPETAKTQRGSKSPYGFDALEINEAFGVKNKTAKQMSSIVSNQNRAKGNQQPKRDDAGNVVFVMQEMKDVNGAVIGKTATSTPETVSKKEWRAIDVTKGSDAEKMIKGTPLEGSKTLVIRIK